MLGVEGGEELLAEGGFDWGEAEYGVAVVTEEEVHRPVAEDADAVVEQDGAAFDLGAFSASVIVDSASTLILE